MGYTHYWDTKPTVSKDRWDNLTQALNILYKDASIIQKEYDDAKPPIANSIEIRFNGIGEDGHETFYIKRKDKPAEWASDKNVVFGFCKTARKPYDKYVTGALILAKMYLQDEIRLNSDGDVSDWQAGVELVNDKLGVNLAVEENPDAEYSNSIETAIIKEAVKVRLPTE